MPEQFLDVPDVLGVFQQMRRKRMAKRVWARRLGDSRFLHGFFHSLLQDRFVHVMSTSLSGASIPGVG